MALARDRTATPPPVSKPAEIPAYLLEEPGGGIPPPLDPAAARLPFTDLPWPEFEKLTLRLASLRGNVEHAQQFGVPGEQQDGIDIYARRDDGAYVVYQCKQVDSLAPGDLTRAIDRFLDGQWSSRATEFVYSTSQSTAPTAIAHAIETQSERLRAQQPPVALTIWGPERLAELLESEANLVRRFFGEVWLARFSPAAAARQEAASLQTIVDELKRRWLE